MSLDSDPEIDAAFSGAEPAASKPGISDDPEIHAAFADSGENGEKGPPPSKFERTFGGLGEIASGLGHSVLGGYKGLYTLATTGDFDKASQAVTSEQNKAYKAPGLDLSGVTNPTQRAALERANQLPSSTELGDIAERHGAGPITSTALATLPTAISFMAGARGMGPEIPKLNAQGVAEQVAARQSGGAAGTAPNVAEASAPLKEAITNADPAKVDPVALTNHLEADQHGISLTKGQATRDPGQFSKEQNSTHPDIVNRLNQQNGQMVDAIDNIRREASPTNVGNDARENGQTVVDSLKAYDEPIQKDIQAKYKALTDANGGNIPIDTGAFLSNVDSALKKQYLTESLPPAANELIKSVRAGEPLDFEGFEAARSRLAEAQREGGSAAQAAKIVRGQLEQMPLSPEAANLKGLADQARAAAKARFDALDKDPAYQAAVNDVANGVKKGQDSPIADQFLDKYALSKTAPKANVDLMMGKLDPEAQGAVSSHALNAVRKQAIGANGGVTPNGYNGALRKLGETGKMDSLVAPETKDSLESLGRVITNAKVAPAGNYVNYSKSGVISNVAHGAAETALSHVPGIKHIAPIAKGVMENNFAKDATKPGAGIER